MYDFGSVTITSEPRTFTCHYYIQTKVSRFWKAENKSTIWDILKVFIHHEPTLQKACATSDGLPGVPVVLSM